LHETRHTRAKGAKGREGLLADRWSGAVIGAAIRVHRALGPGLLESAYQEAVARALELNRVPFERELPVPTFFENHLLATHYRVDFLVGGYLVVELKAVDLLQPVHSAQLLSYLRLGGYPMGLLLNFGQPTLKAGLRRFVNSP
jgi:GxxExxY protein